MGASPYLLPDGNVQIAFSGGRSSAMMLHHILEANAGIPDRAALTFQNTGREMPETLDFVTECGNRWSAPIVWLEYAPRRSITSKELDLVARIFGPRYAARLESWWVPTPSGFRIVSHNSAARHGEPLLALILIRKFLPNQAARFCTTETKVRTAKRYLLSLGWERWTNLCGMRADEPSRLNREQPKERWTADFPLAAAGVTKRDVAAFWRAQPFDLRLPNINGNCWLGNCDGCFLKSEANLSALARDYPNRHWWWEKCEELIGALWPSLTPFQRLRRICVAEPDLPGKLREAYGRPLNASLIQMIVNNPRSASAWSKRYRRHDLRTFMERQSDAFDVNDGQLCQADGGECFG